MKKGSLENTFKTYYNSMKWDRAFLAKVYSEKSFFDFTEKKELYEAFVGKICSTWEMFIDTLLIDCLNRDTAKYSEHTGYRIPKHLSRDICKAVFIGIGYTDFKSVGDLKGTAKKVLPDRLNPFKVITAPNGNKIDEFYTMRNYLSHYSDFSKRSLFKIYKSNYGYAKFREPGEFLIKKATSSSPTPRIAEYIEHFIKAADEMKSFLKI